MWRLDAASAAATIAMVHRPAYDDWSLPKGKHKLGEDSMQTATREIREEIGARAALQMRLGSAAYDTDRGPKLVEYFVLRYLDGQFVPSDEVNEVRWLEPAAAARLASHAADRTLIQTYADLPQVTATVVLVRHARAGKRTAWSTDATRPLSGRGQAQARRLAVLLEPLQPQHILAAPPVRCVETVVPLAARLGLDVDVALWAGDDSFDANPQISFEGVAAAARRGGCTVVCSQGDAIPGLLGGIAGSMADYVTSKGAFWVLSFAAEALISIDRHAAPAS